MVLGRDVLLEVLRTEGVRHVFGNPGSTELPLIDALADADDLDYVLGLQEATVVGMADGYAQATGRPAFLNLHTSAGLGNAIGNLTNARANRTPLVVTAGQQDYRHIATDPLLSGPLVELAGGTVKWGHEIRTAAELGTLLRRAFQDAAHPPAGPVFASLPMDLLDQEVADGAPPASTIERATVAGGLEELADLLTGPAVGRVAIVVGDAVAAAGAVGSAVRLAEALGAPVYGAPLHGRGVFPPLHPLWKGMLTPAAAAIAPVLAAFDRVLLIGEQAFIVYPYTPGPAVPASVELLHLSPDPAQLGRAWPVRLGVAGHPRASLDAMLPLVQARADAAAAGEALTSARTARAAEVSALEETALARYGPAPMDPMAAAHALVRAMPPDSLVVDEAITTGVYVRGFHHWTEPGRYFFCTGGGLGWGMPAACGVSLGHGRAPVLCVVGDGSAMYSPQALWTAASEQLPVVFAVVNNRQYKILKGYLRGMGGSAVRTGRFIGMDLDDPPIDFVALARSMAVDATTLDSTADVGDAVKAALASGRPHVLELPDQRLTRPTLRLSGVRLVRDGMTLLEGVDWQVHADERWVVLGPNGSGKTTLLRVASLYLHPSDGEVEVAGGVLGRNDVRALRTRIGLASPAFGDLLRPQLTGAEVVMTARHAALEPWWHSYDDQDRERAHALLDRFGVLPVAERAVATMSSGERQRVLLARAFAGDPAIVLLDEPTAGLDLGGREDLVTRLGTVAAEASGPPTVLVTHHVEEIPAGTTHALLLREGRILHQGVLPEVLTAAHLSATFGLPVALERRDDRWTARAV